MLGREAIIDEEGLDPSFRRQSRDDFPVRRWRADPEAAAMQIDDRGIAAGRSRSNPLAGNRTGLDRLDGRGNSGTEELIPIGAHLRNGRVAAPARIDAAHPIDD